MFAPAVIRMDYRLPQIENAARNFGVTLGEIATRANAAPHRAIAGEYLRSRSALPMEVRAGFYRELNYCQSLPGHDEMLRILRAMQFLTLLMNQVPDRVVDLVRFELTTSSMPWKRAPNCATGP